MNVPINAWIVFSSVISSTILFIKISFVSLRAIPSSVMAYKGCATYSSPTLNCIVQFTLLSTSPVADNVQNIQSSLTDRRRERGNLTIRDSNGNASDADTCFRDVLVQPREKIRYDVAALAVAEINVTELFQADQGRGILGEFQVDAQQSTLVPR